MKCFAVIILVFLTACSSSPQKLTYYALTPGPVSAPTSPTSISESIGIGPVVLPELHRADGIVTFQQGHQVGISDQHLWAGDLKVGISRSIAQTLSSTLQKDNIFSYPWDVRLQPDWQYFIYIDQISGPLNGEIRLIIRWNQYDHKTKKLVHSRRHQFSAPARSRGYGDYVEDLSALVDQAANSMAHELSGTPNNDLL